MVKKVCINLVLKLLDDKNAGNDIELNIVAQLFQQDDYIAFAFNNKPVLRYFFRKSLQTSLSLGFSLQKCLFLCIIKKVPLSPTTFFAFTIFFRSNQFPNYWLKGVFAKNEKGYRLNAIKKRFCSPLILLLSVVSTRRKLLKTSHTE